MDTYYMLDMTLDAGNIAVEKTKLLTSQSFILEKAERQ